MFTDRDTFKSIYKYFIFNLNLHNIQYIYIHQIHKAIFLYIHIYIINTLPNIRFSSKYLYSIYIQGVLTVQGLQVVPEYCCTFYHFFLSFFGEFHKVSGKLFCISVHIWQVTKPCNCKLVSFFAKLLKGVTGKVR